MYLKEESNIKYVKRHIMPYAQGVEGARYFVEEVRKENLNTETIGQYLDPELEKQPDHFEDQDNLHPDYIQINPDELNIENNIDQTKRTIRNFEEKTNDELLYEARKLDLYQKRVLHIGIQFAEDIL